ncbi:MAG: hypothetical protein ACOCXD_02150 [Bacteroidota bacterium]
MRFCLLAKSRDAGATINGSIIFVSQLVKVTDNVSGTIYLLDDKLEGACCHVVYV